MIVMEDRPELDVRSGCEAELVVERTDILFQDLDGDTVRINIMVRNEGEGLSKPTTMRLESAPLGAFVPWQPLAVVPVPELKPGESHEVSVDASRAHPTALGEFDRTPPQKVLTAVSSPDQPAPQPAAGVLTMLNFMRRQQTSNRPAGVTTGKLPNLAPDLWDLMHRGQPHWAGNLNVFIGQRAVERHLAKALRIYPGRTNLAMFMVGGGARPDAYSFEILGLGWDWKAALYDMTRNGTLLVSPSDSPIREAKWVETNGGMMVILAAQPPAGCCEGKLEVHVRRRSRDDEAVVEFDLDPAAQGAGCYVV
ncbi:MAG: hypothetical protein C5B50_08650 [Verrucomicrobia bacterium]|nr:MAG: hypothetical protein C5B50_08650 [Verrucomicrobiota bacterium]